MTPFLKWVAKITQLYSLTLIQQSCEYNYENYAIEHTFEMLKHQNFTCL